MYITLVTINQVSIDLPLSFFHFFNNINTQFFSLNLTENLLNQILYNHTYLYTFTVRMYDSASLITDLFYILILLGVLQIFYTKLKIIF